MEGKGGEGAMTRLRGWVAGRRVGCRVGKDVAAAGTVVLLIMAGCGSRLPDSRDSSSGATSPATASDAPAPGLTASSCDPDFRPTSTTMLIDPSGSRSKQFRLLDHIVKLIDCTPPTNPDGTRATIRYAFYSLTYPAVSQALVAAAHRGVSVQVLMNSHGDRSAAWVGLVRGLGSDATADSFALTCWQGCLPPRTAALPDGPTAWFSAVAASARSRTVVLTDQSRAGGSPIVSWSWDFGDGTHADGPGPHRKTYAFEGIFDSALTVRDSAGATHRTSGRVTVPDELEPRYPALHAKVFLSSTVGTTASRWVSAYGSGNPTYAQARQGFNNLTVAVGDTQVYAA